ncbi:MAG: sensor histidine kinase [Bacteroidetes bacterium]|nr:MAG: sensor histidine kinase [Bacteroidota bacterium]
MKRLSRNIDFISFGLALLLGAISLVIYLTQHPKLAKQQQQYTHQLIQKRFEALMKKAGQENETIRSQIKEGKFRSLPPQASFAHYIFKGSKLVQWTDYHYVPSPTHIQGDFVQKPLQTTQGFGVLLKTVAEIGQQDTVTIATYLPVAHQYSLENKYLESGYNKALLHEQGIDIKQDSTSFSIVFPDKTPVFGLAFSPTFQGKNINFLWLVGGLAILAVLFGWVALRGFTARLHRKKRYEASILLWGLASFGLRALMIYAVFPYQWTEWDLFNRALYPASRFTPSLGDLALNMLALGGVLMYFLRCYPYMLSYKQMLGLKQVGRIFLVSVLLLLTFLVTVVYYNALGSIFLHPEQRLAIANTLEWTSLNGFGFLMFVALSGFYFFVLHTFTRLCMQFAPKQAVGLNIGILLFVSVGFGAFSWLMKIGSLWLVVFHLAYFITIYIAKLPKTFSQFRYATSIYLFLGALLASSVSTFAIYSFGAKSSLADKRAFGNMLLPENDAVAEQQLGEAIQQIKKDQDFLAYFQSRQAKEGEGKEPALQDKILKQYLGNYFANYDIKLYFYGTQDSLPRYSTGDSRLAYETLSKEFQKIYYDTDNPAIKFINKAGVNSSKHYLAFVGVQASRDSLAHVVIELEQRIIDGQPQNVYPELLLGKNYTLSPLAKHYSYAVYDNDVLVYAKGDFNYEKDFKQSWFAKDELVRQGFTNQGIEHLAVSGGFKKRVVVSAPTYAWWDIFSNFSFFFLLLILCTLLGLLGYSLVKGRYGAHATFATRIQIYLNLAFFLPLFVVSLVTLNIMRGNYQNDLQTAYLRKSETVARNLQPQLLKLNSREITKDEFNTHLAEIARNTGADISLFNREGQLMSSSQPAIYDKANLLAPYINPQALYLVGLSKNRYAILPESVGKLEFTSTYLPLRNYEGDKRQLLGIVGIPFFEAQYEINKKQMELLALMVNIFSSSFIVLVIISFFASRLLTLPLRLITQQVRRTSYTDYNQPLQNQPLTWESKDEIGLFVQEYNKMLKNLDDSRQELIAAQRESAWREMAQQVAHEIKNPLMPMKLGIQMMQRRLEGLGEDMQMMFGRYIETLLEKIDVLDDIATSFSAYARMPIPVMERFDLIELMAETEMLYTETDGDIIFFIPTLPAYIRGDRKLMGRVFVNLIKNALEAMPENRLPHIEVHLSKEEEGLVQISIQDNGTGIPEDVQEKLFTPKFTTKSSGSGIGLALSKRAIEHAGGRIWFETEEEVGTTFFIELPLVE